MLPCSAATVPKHCLQIITPSASLTGVLGAQFYTMECPPFLDMGTSLLLQLPLGFSSAMFFFLCVFNVASTPSSKLSHIQMTSLMPCLVTVKR